MTTCCIVTPDIVGPVRNGGIGTACFHLARYLSGSLGQRVTILFTGPTETGSIDRWQATYRERYGIELLSLADLPPVPDVPCHNGHWFLTRSRQIHEWLAGRSFDQIHFQEWQANGFIPIQAKRSGLAYGSTLLTCTLHSSTEWVREGSRGFVVQPREESQLNYAERYAAQHADIVISPSEHMVDWCQTRGWRLRSPQVIPYLFEDDVPPAAPPSTAVEELCFFGRLETRKGLEIYLSALSRLLDENPGRRLPTLTFLGKEGMVGDVRATSYLQRFAAGRRLNINVIESLPAAEAIAYLRDAPGRVAVMPSLLDNLPYTVIECLQHGIRFIASDVGGIPELVATRSHLFEPTVGSLAAKLADILDVGLGAVPSRYTPQLARAGWRDIASCPSPARPRRSVSPADVTVCIAHHNYGRYLPALLASLERQTVGGFSVLVVDDGSTDRASMETFRRLRDRHAGEQRWNFVEKTNGGIGETRNLAASLASTEYLVFMDADNEAEPDMIEVMVKAMAANPVDCLTCFMRGFADDPPAAPKRILYHYLPIGPCLEAGLFANCFGDANFIVRKEAFFAIGGFGLRRDSSFEDWEFLARLSLKGYTQDVIPRSLFLYRHTPGGFSRSTSTYLNHMRIVSAYAEGLPEWARRMIGDVYPKVVPEVLPREQREAQAERRVGILRQLERSIRRKRKDFVARLRSRRAG